MQAENFWLLVKEGYGPQTGISIAHPDGLVAMLYSTQAAAEQAAADMFQPYPLGRLWEARILATRGYAGLLLDGQTPVFWATTSTSQPQPTHLAIPQGDDYLIVDGNGPTDLKRHHIQLWVDLPGFDRLSNEILLKQLPYYTYQPDQPLHEYLQAADALQLAPTTGALLTASDNYLEGVAFFTTAFAAEWFWEGYSVALTGEGETASQITTHADIPARLESLRDLPDEVAILLNPGRHRFYQGFFRRVDGQWYLITINGLWRVDAPFTLVHLARRSN